jgi:hypothetical protein
MKICPECGMSYPVRRVLCLQCGEILDERQYLRLIYATLAAAFGLHLILGRAGYPGRGLISETFMSGTFFLLICIVAWKTVQKIRQPQRRILYELASLYSDQIGRAMLLSAIIVCGLFILQIGIPRRVKPAPEPHAMTVYRKARYLTVVYGGITYAIVALSIQRGAFFNFRLKNSLLDRELKEVEAESQASQENTSI